jgi:hypothetical protein
VKTRGKESNIPGPQGQATRFAVQRVSARDLLCLCGLTAAAILVHGYHVGIEDMAVYLPAIKKLLDPSLYPFDANFFLLYIRWTMFHQTIAASVRWTHLPLEWVMFLWHIGGIFLVLLGCLRLIRRCLPEAVAHWAGVSLIAALLTMPVTGTALFVVDQHLHPRTFATAFLLFATVDVLEMRLMAVVWVLLAFLAHPTMGLYGICHLVILGWPAALWPGAGWRGARPAALAAASIPFGEPANPIWREVMSHRGFQYPLRWEWYEWLGAIGPIVVLWFFARLGESERLSVFARVCRRVCVSTSIGIAGAIVMTEFLPGTWVRFEPMRILHFTYVVFLLFTGGVLGQYVLKKHPIRWILLLAPIVCGLFYGQRHEFASTYHIEWPGRAAKNEWAQAFEWCRANTPRDALFALDPRFMKRPGEDYFGFRGIAERSMLADGSKDTSVVEVFPELAWQWKLETEPRKNWVHFQLADFQRLKRDLRVSWVIVQQPGVAGLDCPYANGTVLVCRIP